MTIKLPNAGVDKADKADRAEEGLEEFLQELVNRGGSFSGETISSRHSRLSRHGSHSLSVVARRLREPQSFDAGARTQRGSETLESADAASSAPRKRFNNSFHHFRFLVVTFGGLSVGLMLFLRYNITISILKMINQTEIYLEEHPGNTVEDMLADGYTPGGEFDWNNEIQQMIMSWYMVAYTLPQLPMAKVGTMIGSRAAVPLSLGLCAVSTLLTPAFAYLGWQYVIFLRLVNGFGASPILPMLISLLESWLRKEEISLGLGIAQALALTLVALNPAISGYLSSIHWSVSFYVPGVAALVFCLVWLLLISDLPDANPLVSESELAHIYAEEAPPSGLKTQATSEKQDERAYKADSWTAMLRVAPFYAFCACWMFQCSSFNAFNFLLPTYLSQFLKVSTSQNGLYCTIIQTGSILAVIWPHAALRLLRTKFGLSEGAARCVVLGVCCSMVALTWIVAGTLHQFLLVLLFLNRCTQNGIDLIVTSSVMLNFARAGLSALAYSAMNTVGNLSVVFSSTLVGWYLDYTGQSETGWCVIFVTLGAAQGVTWLIYASTIRAEPLKLGPKHAKKAALGQAA